jgi:hypothetical protein
MIDDKQIVASFLDVRKDHISQGTSSPNGLQPTE